MLSIDISLSGSLRVCIKSHKVTETQPDKSSKQLASTLFEMLLLSKKSVISFKGAEGHDLKAVVARYTKSAEPSPGGAILLFTHAVGAREQLSLCRSFDISPTVLPDRQRTMAASD